MVIRIFAIIWTVSFTIGCGGLAKDEMLLKPDSPMLILEANGDVRVAVWDDEARELVEYGWVELDDQFNGWTIWRPDWPAP